MMAKQNADAQEALAEEVDESLRKLLGDSIDHDAVRKMVLQFSSFEESKPSGSELERVYLRKDSKWLPTSGKSIKPGNLRFNLGQLFEAIVGGAGAATSALTSPILGALVGIVAARKLVEAATIDLDQDDASVLWAVWLCKQKGQVTNVSAIHSALMEECARLGEDTRETEQAVAASLRNLARVGTVRESNGAWELLEMITVET
jgi:hypothetical protein